MWATSVILVWATVVLLGSALPLVGWVDCRWTCLIMFRLMARVARCRVLPQRVRWQVLFTCTLGSLTRWCTLGPVSLRPSEKLGTLW